MTVEDETTFQAPKDLSEYLPTGTNLLVHRVRDPGDLTPWLTTTYMDPTTPWWAAVLAIGSTLRADDTRKHVGLFDDRILPGTKVAIRRLTGLAIGAECVNNVFADVLVVNVADVVAVHARPADVVGELLGRLLQEYQEASGALERCRNRATHLPGYVKADWQTIDAALSIRFREAAEALGHRRPLVFARRADAPKSEDA